MTKILVGKKIVIINILDYILTNSGNFAVLRVLNEKAADIRQGSCVAGSYGLVFDPARSGKSG